ncbi:MAG: adenylate/guanylate cyclase domain-containing protein [Lachnospiraceae bacterium]|nr:adenylate/guanylate cyclase domain-containing protein [Lachnospiraceae bacterium]
MNFFKKSSILRNIIVGSIIAVLCTALFLSNILYSVDSALSDVLYQKAKALPGDIVLINIDQYALDMMGNFSYWGRETMGDVLNILNADPENAPAVVGIDVLYVGESQDPDGDAYLAEMAGSGCPVVVACAAVFGNEFVNNGDEFYMDENSVLAFDLPYDDLYYNTWIGHINSKFDTDGILRHGLWYIQYDEETQVPSFHRQIYELYCQTKGIEANTTPKTDENGTYYIPFQGKPGDFSDGYSVYDLLTGEIDPSAYAGKIVLIGPYAAGMQDDFTTSIDHAVKMYGIEYQANMIQALLNGDTKSEADRLPQAVCIFVITLLMWIFLKNRRIVAATAGWILSVGGYVALCMLIYSKADTVISPFYVPLYVTILYVVSVAVNYVRAALEKRKVTATFQRYVAPEIVNELLKEGSDMTELKGRNCDIAVLFVDIRGFTSMSEVLSPEEVVEILDRYLTLTSQCIFKNKGTLDKFVGDCTMAFWGAPLPQDDIIYKAVKTGFDMIEGAADLRKELLEKYGRTVDFGIGVHYGPAVVGNIGAPNRMDFTAIGDTVNTASRLEANAPKGTLYVSRVVADALEGRVEFKSLGDSIKLKGKAEGFEVIEAVKLIG